MKTMTAANSGDPATSRPGETADDRHHGPRPASQRSREGRDATHQQARDAMKARWLHPKKSMDWYRDMKKAFSDLPED
jgi:hypothetical protein